MCSVFKNTIRVLIVTIDYDVITFCLYVVDAGILSGSWLMQYNTNPIAALRVSYSKYIVVRISNLCDISLNSYLLTHLLTYLLTYI